MAGASRTARAGGVDAAAIRTGASVGLVLGDADESFGEFGDLMADRGRIIWGGVGRQRGLTAGTLDRDVGDDLVDLFGRKELLEIGRMTGPGAAFLAGRLLGRSRSPRFNQSALQSRA